MAKRTIAHSLFWYETEAGVQQFAMRGAEVELSAKDIRRGEAHGAFVTAAPEPSPDDLGPFPVDGDTAVQDAWMAKATGKDVLAAAEAQPDSKTALFEAENRRQEPRVTVLTALSR